LSFRDRLAQSLCGAADFQNAPLGRALMVTTFKAPVSQRR